MCRGCAPLTPEERKARHAHVGSGPRFDPAERFWSKVKKDGECWEWTGRRDPNGYGRFNYKRASRWAHRVAYELTNGKIPGELLVRHKCDNPPCVNPGHLETGTVRDNAQDAIDRGRFQWRVDNKCQRGHTDWVKRKSSNGHYCRQCNLMRCRRRTAEKRAQR